MHENLRIFFFKKKLFSSAFYSNLYSIKRFVKSGRPIGCSTRLACEEIQRNSQMRFNYCSSVLFLN